MAKDNASAGGGAAKKPAKNTFNPATSWATWGAKPPASGPGSEFRLGVSPLPIRQLPSSGGGGGTGVTRGLFAGVNIQGGPQNESAPDTRPGVFDQIRQSYGALTDELMRMRDDYARQIGESTGSTARFLEMVDPTAAYRITAPSLQASPAAATSYLNAIGANPAQVEAQRDFANQMMASQMADQTGYQRAVDTTNQAYRQAQLAELYRNQAEAQAGLNAATMGQRAQIGMAQLQQENAIRNALLEYQLALLQAQAQRGGGMGQLPFRNIGSINF